MRVLVTGGTGFVGSHLVEALLAGGHDVRCLVRPGRSGWLPADPRVHLAEGSLENAGALRDAAGDREVVFHLAGLTRALRREDFHRVNHEGTRAVVLACRGAPSLRRLVYASSLAAAGPSPDGRPLREDDPPRPIDDYGVSKLRGEEAVRAEAARVPATIVRLPAVYGPRDTDFLAAFRAVRRGVLPVPARGARIDLCHVSDAVAALLLVAGRQEATGATYFVAGDRPLSWEQAGDAMAAALGVRAVAVPVPGLAAMGLAVGAEAWARVTGRASVISRDKVREMRARYWVCDPSRIRALGFAPHVTPAEGFRLTAQWYREAGWL